MLRGQGGDRAADFFKILFYFICSFFVEVWSSCHSVRNVAAAQICICEEFSEPSGSEMWAWKCAGLLQLMPMSPQNMFRLTLLKVYCLIRLWRIFLGIPCIETAGHQTGRPLSEDEKKGDGRKEITFSPILFTHSVRMPDVFDIDLSPFLASKIKKALIRIIN